MRGITPVVAIILLLLITVSIVGFSFMFLSRMTQTTTQRGEQQLRQQTQQAGILFSLEGVDKNHVYIRNLGGVPILNYSLAFYVNNQPVNANGPSSLNVNSVGEYFLNDSILSTLPDPAALRVSGGTFSDSRNVCFYCKYTSGYWKFDEGSGTTAADSSGSGNDGTINGATWTAGISGNALNFDGINDYVLIGDGALKSTSFTLEGWARFTSTANPGVIVGKYNNGFLWFDTIAPSRMRVEFRNAADTAWRGIPQDGGARWTPQINVWYHFVATFDGSGGRIRLYVNGTQESRTAVINEDTRIITEILAIGRWGSDSSRYFNGVIDEVRILNVARSMTTA